MMHYSVGEEIVKVREAGHSIESQGAGLL